MADVIVARKARVLGRVKIHDGVERLLGQPGGSDGIKYVGCMVTGFVAMAVATDKASLEVDRGFGRWSEGAVEEVVLEPVTEVVSTSVKANKAGDVVRDG